MKYFPKLLLSPFRIFTFRLDECLLLQEPQTVLAGVGPRPGVILEQGRVQIRLNRLRILDRQQ